VERSPTSEGRVEFGPLREGLLDEDLAGTFRSSTYAEVTRDEPTTLYRVHGDRARELGAFWSETPPAGPYQAQYDLALHPSFGNDATRWVEIEVPPGTRYYKGAVGDQGGLLGGGDQVFFHDVIVQEDWIVRRGTFPQETP